MKPALSLTVLAIAGYAMAGFDGWYVVAKVSGKVEARQLIRRGNAQSWTAWRPIRRGDFIDPPSEIRTSAASKAWIQTGSVLRDPAKLRTDERVDTYILAPGTLVRTNGASMRGPKIFIVERGTATLHSEQGKRSGK